MSVYLAYDGSVNGDWLMHYAVRLAAASGTGILTAVIIEEQGQISSSWLDEKLEWAEHECEREKLMLHVEIHRRTGSVADSLCQVVPAGAESFLLCGTRVGAQKRGLLAGTVSEKLLRRGHCQTLAIRVVRPAVFGQPRILLAPLAGHPRGLSTAVPFLRLFAPHLDELHLLTVREVARWRFRLLSARSAARLAQSVQAGLQQAEQEIEGQAPFAHLRVESHHVVSDDVPTEIVIAANRVRSQLIFLGASDRNLRERFFYGNPIEHLLREAPCDVAIYRGAR